MINYKWSPSHLSFFPVALLSSYEDAGWDLNDLIDVSDGIYIQYTSTPPEGKQLGSADGMPAWVEKPLPPNSELRKAALTSLSKIYQDDIFNLNMAWVAAGVNDGVNEMAKKDVVLSQINNRKTQYASDRAAIIAQYPD